MKYIVRIECPQAARTAWIAGSAGEARPEAASVTPGTPVYTPAGNAAVYVRPAPGGHQGQPEESHIVRFPPTVLLPGTGPVLVIVGEVFAELVNAPRGNEVIK